jgi:hypothetical protein
MADYICNYSSRSIPSPCSHILSPKASRVLARIGIMPSLAGDRSDLYCDITAPLRATLQRHCTENPKQIFPEMKLRGLIPNSYIPTPSLLQQKRRTDRGNIYIVHRYLNVGIGNEAAQFYFWEYINPIFFPVYSQLLLSLVLEEPSSLIWQTGPLLYWHRIPSLCSHP